MNPHLKFDDTLTTAQAVQLAGVSVKTITRWIESGSVEGHKIGEARTAPFLVSKKSLQKYLTKKRDQVGET